MFLEIFTEPFFYGCQGIISRVIQKHFQKDIEILLQISIEIFLDPHLDQSIYRHGGMDSSVTKKYFHNYSQKYS